jgi:F-type H+-transporting ATPase subunit b
MMMRLTMTLAAASAGGLLASPVLAADGPFISLGNTDFVVLVSFLCFVGILIYFKIPGLLTGLLDKRADGIRAELDEARALREEAQTLLASFERKQGEVAAQSDRIIAHARAEAEAAGEKAKDDIKASIARRLVAAEDQIGSAEQAAVREVRDSAIQIAIGAAAQVVTKQMSDADQDKLIDDAIGAVEKRLH